MNLSEPALFEEAQMHEVEAADPAGGLFVWWLGQSAFLVQSSVGSALFDPVFPGSATHVAPQALDPDKRSSIDVVVLGHSEIDDAKSLALKRIFAANSDAAFLVPEPIRTQVSTQLGCDPAWPWGLNDGESVSFGRITILAVPDSSTQTEHDAAVRPHRLDYVVWFGDLKVYHSGDSRYQIATANYLRPLAVDVVLLPIHGNRPDRRAPGYPTDAAAARFAHEAGARLAIPFEHETRAPPVAPSTLFAETCRSLGQPYKILRRGERLFVPQRT